MQGPGPLQGASPPRPNPTHSSPSAAAPTAVTPPSTQPPQASHTDRPSDADLGHATYASHFANAPAHEHVCLARALYYEARGEPYDGQVAVAQVVMNRVRAKHWPDSICGVVNQGTERGEKCQFSFACHPQTTTPSGDAWDQAQALATEALAGRAWLRETLDATHYHTTSVAPIWRLSLASIGTLGRHIFYRDTDAAMKATKPYAPSFNPPLANLGAVKANQTATNVKVDRAKQLVKVQRPTPSTTLQASNATDTDWASRAFRP
jgi:spore germination cell wall hydrolase CwlJ-like protein